MAEIPRILTSSTEKISKKHRDFQVNEDSLLKRGFPVIPANSKESIYLNAFDEVPLEWRRQVYDYMCGGTTDPENKVQDPITTRFRSTVTLNWKTLHLIVYLVQTRKTSLCYDTSGYLDKVTEHVKLGVSRRWYTLHEYDKLLDYIHISTKDNLFNIRATDKLLRQKRAEPPVSKFGATTADGRSFTFASYFNEKGETQFSWLDLSHKAEMNRDQLLQQKPPPPIIKGQCKCHSKECTITADLLQCSRCRNVFYCSVLHQREDWPLHKLVCCK